MASQGEEDDTTHGEKNWSHTQTDGVREDPEREKFDMWNAVDQYDEKHVIKESKQMKILDRLTGAEKKRKNRRVSIMRTGVITEEEKKTHKLELPENMKLTNDDVQHIIDHFIAGEKLHLHHAQNILKALHGLLSHSPNKVDISVPKKGLLTVVGDTHGQFSDLVYILNRQKMPSKTNYYLFNGDFVDRGSFGCEVFLVLAALKIANPTHFFMNRGNHESERYNIAYGFEKEVIHKFDVKTFHLFEQCFNWLPLCHVVNKSVFVVHAGLPRHTRATLKHIKHIHRNQQIPDEPQSMEDQIMQDLLWSDPVEEPGLSLSDRGAGCLFGEDITDQFLKHNKLKLIVRSHECIDDGCEATHHNKVYTLFSASNYCGDAGNYGAIMTFSYKKHSPTEIHQYMAPVLDVEKGTSMAEIEEQEEKKAEEAAAKQEMAAEAAAAKAKAQAKQDMETKRRQEGESKTKSPPPAAPHHKLPPAPPPVAKQAAAKAKLTKLNKLLDKIAEYILRYHEDLEFHFQQVDTDNDGFVQLSVWTTIMSDTLQLKLQWTKLRAHIAPDGDQDKVDYRKFLGRYFIDFGGDHSFFNGIVSKIRNAIFINGGDLHAMFEEFDLDKDGVISATEFKSSLERIVGMHMADSQIHQLLRSIDTEGHGFIDYPEFAAKFEVHAATPTEEEGTATTGIPAAPEAPGAWMEEFVTGMGAAMQRSKSSLTTLFSKFDTNNDGRIDYDEFHQTLRDMQCPLSDEEMKKVAVFMDKDQDGFIDIDEFAAGFRIGDSVSNVGTNGVGYNVGNGNDDPHHWESRVKHQLLRMFYHNKASLMHVFVTYDEDHDGFIDQAMFIQSLQALLSVQDEVNISDESLEHLSQTLVNEKGTIDYTLFVDSFSMNAR